MDFSKISDLLKAEVRPALGCTGPIGVSYAAAEARDAVGGTPIKIKIFCDKDTAAKNDDVGIPGTSVKGLKMAAALGAIAGDASAKSSPVNALTSTQFTLECSKYFPLPVFNSRVSQTFRSISTEAAMSNPASENPMSKPPAPENKLKVLIGSTLFLASHALIARPN